jgi:hypothetical protein
MHITAEYTGSPDERGYKRGQSYDLVLRETTRVIGRTLLTLTPTVREAPEMPRSQMYKSVEALLDEWTDIKLKK